jgi:hypothetical protein
MTVETARSACVTKIGAIIPFDRIEERGAYICNWSGHLLRVPEAIIAAGRSTGINIVGSEPLTVTKISDNPLIPLRQAKETARQFELSTNF